MEKHYNFIYLNVVAFSCTKKKFKEKTLRLSNYEKMCLEKMQLLNAMNTLIE